MATTPDPARTYDVRIEFLSGDELFAEIHILLDDPDGGEIEERAAALAEASPYYNDRVPDLSYRATIVPANPDDPDPPPAGARVKPICPRCGADDLVRDACARWDDDIQGWSLSGIYDCTACAICGAESDDLARWVASAHVTVPDQFTSDLAALLVEPALVDDPAFRFFCLDHFRTHDLASAAAAWKAQVQPAP